MDAIAAYREGTMKPRVFAMFVAQMSVDEILNILSDSEDSSSGEED